MVERVFYAGLYVASGPFAGVDRGTAQREMAGHGERAWMTDWRKTPRLDNPESLLALARDKSREGREQLFQTISDMFAGEVDDFSDPERRMMGEILRQLIVDVEAAIRRTLAERLADMPGAPAELIRDLANDAIDVAHPILLRSNVLKDAELIEIIRHRTLEHQLAIAMRASVSADVSDALVDTGADQVLETLLENPGAVFRADTFEKLVDASEEKPGLQAPLLRRQELTPALARKMHWWVSAALRQAILERYGEVDQVVLEESLEAAVGDVLGDAVLGDIDPFDTILASKNMADPELGEDEMVKALAKGDVATFEAMLAKRTGLRLKLLRRLMFEPGGEGLAIACRGAGITPKLFAAIYRLTREAHPRLRLEKGELARVTKLYLNMQLEAAESVLRKWRRNPDFLWAIRQVNEAV